MSIVLEKDLYGEFKERRFSTLNFLYEVSLETLNAEQLAVLYFLMDFKGEDNTEVFAELEKKKSSKASTFLFLARISTKIFDNHNGIERSYIKAAHRSDETHADALFALHSIDHNPKHLLDILEQYRNQNSISDRTDKSALLNVLTSMHYNSLDRYDDLTKLDWELIRDCHLLILNEKLLNKDALAFAYLKLNEIDLGLEIIRDCENLNYSLLKYCLDHSLLSEEEVLEKVYDFELNKLTKDPAKLYKKAKMDFDKESKVEKLPNLILKAFDAKEYEDVISYFEQLENSKENFGREHTLLAYYWREHTLLAYYLMANFFLIDSFNEEKYKKLIQLKVEEYDQPTINIVKCYKLLQGLKIQLQHPDRLVQQLFRIERTGEFKELEKYMADEAIVSNVLYADLTNRKDEILKIQEEIFIQNFLNSDLCKKLDLVNPQIESLYDCKTLYLSQQYRLLITALENWHQNNSPSVLSYEYMAASYWELSDKANTYKYYKLAYELCETTKENNQGIDFQYLSILEDLHPDHTEEIAKVKEKYNLDLTSLFRIQLINHKRYFKYCPFNINTIDALANQYFYFPDKAKLNDPIELPDIEYKLIPKDISNKYRVFSLSENDNSMLMWSHYASNHEGICIGFRLGGFLPYGVGIYPIEYTNHLKRNYDVKDLRNRFAQYLLTKNKDWSYEKETRIFTFKDKIHYENFDYVSYDREKIDAYISSITLGCAFPKHKENLIKQLIVVINKNNPNNPKIILQRAVIPESNPFSLEYESMDY